MISFPSITTANMSVSTRVQPQVKNNVENTQNKVVDFTAYNQATVNSSAIKAQVADVKLNQNFYNNIQYLNAQASVGMHKQVDGKIFVSTDVFHSIKNEKFTVSSLLNRLNNIDNLAKDRNGSQSLLYTKANKKQDSDSKLQKLYA